MTDIERIRTEDVLRFVYGCQQESARPTVEAVAGTLQISLDEASLLLTTMTARNLLKMENDHLSLTRSGQVYAIQVTRAHRLWERYLADETGFDETEWHTRADQREHELTEAEIDALSAQLGHPTHDPHGDPIPNADGHLVPHGGSPLSAFQIGDTARIVHIEDEPPVVYAQLVAEGLYVGMEVKLAEKTPERLSFWADGQQHMLAPMFARNISAILIPQSDEAQTAPDRLSDLSLGERAKIVGLSPVCHGTERRRLLDLGILPGTEIKAELISPSGDPTAYLVRRSLIALRKEQADLIYISPAANGNTHDDDRR